MLLQIMPEQVVQFKELIKESIEESIPPIQGESVNKVNNILAKLLVGEMVGWIIYRKEGDVKRTIGFMITRIIDDDITETKSVLIYCIYVMERSYTKDWIEGLEALSRYGSAHGCSRIVGYILEEAFLRRIVQLGGGIQYYFISVPLVKI